MSDVTVNGTAMHGRSLGGRMKLVGVCNQCGLCCTKGDARCANLVTVGRVGEPGATRCGAYAWRFEGMPVYAIDAQGVVVHQGRCRKDSAGETAAIAPWIGKGCSLQVAL